MKDKRPLMITQNGVSSAVILDVETYQEMLDKIEFVEELLVAEKQIEYGEVISHEVVKDKIL
jgi:PHD/YefM family antitoxin component YafN of YafNO toxin-antitoxin module